MKFGELTTAHLGRQIKVYGTRHAIIIGAIHHEIYYGRPRTVLFDVAKVRKWIYLSDRECVLS